MITTDFVPGSPCWLDLGAPDVPAAAAFYGAVFGWEFQSMGEEAPDYGFLKLGGRTVAGIGPLTEKGARSAWMIYFHTTDADATARNVEQAGGTIRLIPMDADSEGRMAQFSDPSGGQFAVWQPADTNGLEVVDEPGSLCWTELYTTDAAGAREFYGNLFGWDTEDMPLPGGGGTYTLITPAGLGQERMQGGLMQLPSEHLTLTGGRPYWHPVFASADCDITVEKVRKAGGTVQMGPEDAEGVGRLAVCVDTAGADFVVLTPSD
ncbi:VOC family protein [Streptomyces sp. ISL-11]|uniref:VOC family protein n=1 Tax=Streptomyces sp. ISL-11 TaxID=2819174 RepID=UPI001BED1EA8|nr:VOC family protein [Streptomyces sp. ISL-11]MBT2384698.1 VOC family protein [Streptomyces sp. ISL-11]